MSFIVDLAKKYRKLITYGLYSVLVTLIDIGIVWILNKKLHINLVLANTIGVVAGSIIQYFSVIGNVFDQKVEARSFLIFFGTFLIGLFLADLTIYISDMILVNHFSDTGTFILAKGMSIVLPFFIMYGLRKFAYSKF